MGSSLNAPPPSIQKAGKTSFFWCSNFTPSINVLYSTATYDYVALSWYVAEKTCTFRFVPLIFFLSQSGSIAATWSVLPPRTIGQSLARSSSRESS